MRLKRWIWDILQDGKDHWFMNDKEVEYGIGIRFTNGVRYNINMFETGVIDSSDDDGTNYWMKNGWSVRKDHVEPEQVVALPKELFEI